MKRSLTSIALTLLCLNTAAAHAQTASNISDVPAAEISKPEVRIPTVAKRTGIGGEVMVRVAVDMAGKVTSVEKISGPGAVCQYVSRDDVTALRESARNAALQTKFEPARSNGAPVDSTAVIRFNFRGDKDSSLNAMIMGTELPESSEEKFYSASTTPPLDYKGPVNTAGKPSEVQATPGQTTETLSGGVLNGKALELPRPAYPRAAMAVKATGSVPVQVLIDEHGEVFLARAVEGHPLLRSAAVDSACKAKFYPTLLSGAPVKVSGIITYNFVP